MAAVERHREPPCGRQSAVMASQAPDLLKRILARWGLIPEPQDPRQLVANLQVRRSNVEPASSQQLAKCRSGYVINVPKGGGNLGLLGVRDAGLVETNLPLAYRAPDFVDQLISPRLR